LVEDSSVTILSFRRASAARQEDPVRAGSSRPRSPLTQIHRHFRSRRVIAASVREPQPDGRFPHRSSVSVPQCPCPRPRCPGPGRPRQHNHGDQAQPRDWATDKVHLFKLYLR